MDDLDFFMNDPEFSDFLDAIAEVETGGESDPDNATGDGGKALGRYQIWEIYWSDALERNPELGGEYNDVSNPDYAAKVMISYWNRYCPEDLRNRNYEKLARVHNEGPSGWGNDKAAKYWDKVKENFSVLRIRSEMNQIYKDVSEYMSNYTSEVNIIEFDIPLTPGGGKGGGGSS